MPKSKRNKQIELSKTKKRGLEWKKHLFEEIRSCVDSYTNIFVFSVNDMRNSKMKNVREQWKHSRFFIGKNKIMSMALGRSLEEEYKPNLHKVGQQLKGQCGLLFSNKSTEEVLSWFRSYSEGDYARSGNIATEDVKLSTGPLSMFPHNLEPYLRQLGLPTSLVKGVIHLVKDHEVCKAGDTLSPETAKILKLLGYEMAEFHITIECVWSQDGSFMQFTDKVETNAKENIKTKRKSGQKKKKVPKPSDVEEMEVVELNLEETNATESTKVSFCNVKFSNLMPEEMSSKVFPEKTLNNSIANKSVQDIDLINNNTVLENNNNTLSVVDSVDDVHANNFSSTPKNNSVKENNHGLFENSLKINKEEKNIPENAENNADVKKKDEITDEGDNEKNSRQSRPRKRKINKSATKNESLLKTPDNANKSQDSPIFRQLRNRSVKVSKKKAKK